MKSSLLKTLRYAAICLALVVTDSWALQESTGANPSINAHYHDAEFDQWVDVFERSGREVYDHREEILTALALKPGQKVADIGAGTGLFTIPMAQRVTNAGKVYAVDISENFVNSILNLGRESELDNIEGIVNSQSSTELPAASIDLAFICATYHHFEFPDKMLQSIHSALQENGELVVIDFRRDPHVSNSWVMGHVRANVRQVIGEIEAQGFRLIKSDDFMKTNYFLRFQKTQ